MTLILRLAGVALAHLAFFACYPATGPAGSWYLWISLAVWAVFILFIATGAGLVKIVSGAAGRLINLAAFAAMLFAIAATMPQSDGVSVLAKLRAGRYPDAAAVRSGMQRFGLCLDRGMKAPVTKQLERKLGKAVRKLKED